MNITWYGQTCFQIVAQKAKDIFVKIIIDPLEQGIGLRLPKLEADILLESCPNRNYSDVKGDAFLITGPGEYEIKDVFIQGIKFFDLEKKTFTIYTIETEDIKICHLGRLSSKELDNGILEKIGNIDILMIPVGDGDALSGQEATKIINQIGPKLVIPMYYQIPKLSKSLKLETVDKFLKAMGKKSIEPQNKFSIKKKFLPKDGLEIVVLEP